jgi:hypothetical protein
MLFLVQFNWQTRPRDIKQYVMNEMKEKKKKKEE